jgi:hypothetical protein
MKKSTIMPDVTLSIPMPEGAAVPGVSLEERLRKAEAVAAGYREVLLDRFVVCHDSGCYECILCDSMHTVPGLNPHQPSCVLFPTFENDIRLVPR